MLQVRLLYYLMLISSCWIGSAIGIGLELGIVATIITTMAFAIQGLVLLAAVERCDIVRWKGDEVANDTLESD